MAKFDWLSSSLVVAFLCLTVLAAVNSQTSSTLTKNTNGNGHLIDLDEENWHSILTGEWMVEFFAPWCPACKNLAPTWERFARTAKEVDVNVGKIDVTSSPSLSGRFFVTALPTIYHVKDGDFRQYRGSRDGDALLFFIKQKQWEKIEPLSAWKKPDTLHMSMLSYFFKLSHTLKDFNAQLQDEYGLPAWGSYALFAIGTIFIGAGLGLMLVCIVDFIYPPKKYRHSFSESQGDDDSVENLATEDIEDDEEAAGDDDDDDDNENDDDEDEDNAGGEEEQDDDDDEDEEEAETSEGEKQSHSESEAEEDKNKDSIGDNLNKPSSNKTTAAVEADQVSDHETEPSAPAANKTEVRKRKPRKAD